MDAWITNLAKNGSRVLPCVWVVSAIDLIQDDTFIESEQNDNQSQLNEALKQKPFDQLVLTKRVNVTMAVVVCFSLEILWSQPIKAIPQVQFRSIPCESIFILLMKLR